MKRIALILTFITICSMNVFASGELPTKFKSRAIPPPVVNNSAPSFLTRVTSYCKNRVYDVVDVVVETGDAVVGVFTLDPLKDDDEKS